MINCLITHTMTYSETASLLSFFFVFYQMQTGDVTQEFICVHFWQTMDWYLLKIIMCKYNTDAKCYAFVHLCLGHAVSCGSQFRYCWQLEAPEWGSAHFMGSWLFGVRRAVVFSACHGQSQRPKMRWCQAALSTVAGSHILNNGQLQHTALPLSPLILCHALGLRWPGCMPVWLHNWRKETNTHNCSLRFMTWNC